MRLCTVGIVGVVITAGLLQSSDAIVRPRDAEAPRVFSTRAPRTQRTTAFAPGAAGLRGWTAIWDRDTDVPLRMWGAGEPASGAVANAAIAEAAARRFLAAHIGALAPGAAVADFELVSNALSRNRDVRSVGFVQRAGGVRVVGGAIGFAFKADRLVMVSSTALPNVAVSAPPRRIAPATAAARATSWLASAGFTVAAKPAPGAPQRIVPIVRPRIGAAVDIEYRLAEQVTVESSTGPGRWEVWLDARDGAPIARRSLLHYASGVVLFDVPERHPKGTRTTRPSIFATHTVDAVATTSAIDGTLTWEGTADATVATAVTGPLVSVTNKDGAPTATKTLTLAPDHTVTWSEAENEAADANLTAFIYANEVKQFVKTRLAPELAWLDGQLSVVTNEAGRCNAFSTGDDIHFFVANAECQNTARIADVVYHEFGHSVHIQSIIEGVGEFEGAASEGFADVLATLITNDSGMGRGFRFTDEPLRELNPAGKEKRWPDDVTGEVHDDGEILGGAMWDLRVALEAKLGRAAGYEKVLDIYYAMLQRSTDIPSTYAEALLADDDDGNLANRTPNQCEIDAVFAAHGLADFEATLGIEAPVRDGLTVSLPIVEAAAACPDAPRLQSVTLEWQPRGAGPTQQLAFTQEAGQYIATLPPQADGTVVQYKVIAQPTRGAPIAFPNNPADPMFEFYVGPVTTIQCFGFEGGLEGWTPGTTPGSEAWQVGQPRGLSSDPKEAHSGIGVLGLDLDEDGKYPSLAKASVESPELDVAGLQTVRVQFYRWLGVEDGFYDRARIYANGVEVWNNFASSADPGLAGINHTDQEWRFSDVDISVAALGAKNGKVRLRFELESDTGFELGGWTLDDVCVVGIEASDSGCCSTGGSPAGPAALALLTLGLVVVRRRRR